MKNIIALCFMVCLCYPAQGQMQISGIITDENARPISSATVQVLNIPVVASSGIDGRFLLEAVGRGHWLRVSHSGFASITRYIHPDSSHNLEFILKPSYSALEEVVVSSQKQEELLLKVPLSVTSINAKQVIDYRLWNIKELGSLSPNLFLADPGDKRNVTSIRGITSTSYDPAIATYIDGVNQFGLDTYIAQLFDIERIEIARGPQGTLYGRNAMGGVVSIYTRQPANTANGFAELSVGNYGQQRAVAGIRLPLVKSRLFFGAAGSFEKTNGFYRNEFDGSKYDKQQSISGNYYLKYLTSSKWSATINMKHVANRNNGAFPLVMDAEQALESPYLLSHNATTRMIDNTVNISLSLAHSSSSLQFSSQTAMQQNYRFYESPIDADFSTLDAVSIFNNYGGKWNKVKVFTQEFRLSSPAARQQKLTWVAGAYLFRQQSPVKQATVFGNDAQMIGMPDNNFSLVSSTKAESLGVAVYGQASYSLTQKLKLTAGLRYDREKKKQSILGEYVKEPDPASPFRTDTASSNDFSAFSPKLGISYDFTTRGILFFSYSGGFRAGGLTPISSDPSQPPLFRFNPEQSYNLELGVKNSVSSVIDLGLSLFYTQVNDVQVPTLILPEAVTIIRNTGRLVSKGIELDMQSAFRGLELNYAFGYTDARYHQLKLSRNNMEEDLRNKKQVFTPAVTSSLALQYGISFSRSALPRLVLRGEWRHFGKQFFDQFNTIVQEPYHLFHLRLGMELKQLAVHFWVRNITDRRYIGYAYDFGAVRLGDPRNYGLIVGISF